MSQDSAVRLILFNVFLGDLFLILKDIDFASYAAEAAAGGVL